MLGAAATAADTCTTYCYDYCNAAYRAKHHRTPQVQAVHDCNIQQMQRYPTMPHLHQCAQLAAQMQHVCVHTMSVTVSGKVLLLTSHDCSLAVTRAHLCANASVVVLSS